MSEHVTKQVVFGSVILKKHVFSDIKHNTKSSNFRLVVWRGNSDKIFVFSDIKHKSKSGNPSSSYQVG